jgi:hypothetical protein
MKERYIIALPGNKYVDIDRNSGGYPYTVDDPARAHVWTDKQRALDYLEMFNRSENSGLALGYLCTVEYVIKPV